MNYTCSKSGDGFHCVCWWDGKGPCCFCKSNEGTVNEVSQ